MLKYYPNDRTASVVLAKDSRLMDQRRLKPPSEEGHKTGTAQPYISGDFLGERHLCQKWVPKGATPRSGSLLASSVMETVDFNAIPRSGKAIDFVHRISLFEKPMVDLSGKRFTVHDAAITGTHRADASALEMSDATLSIALLKIGTGWEYKEEEAVQFEEEETEAAQEMPQKKAMRRSSIEMGADGYPIIWMKYTRKQGDKTTAEVKSYRTSYVRAALLLATARQDAQQQVRSFLLLSRVDEFSQCRVCSA